MNRVTLIGNLTRDPELKGVGSENRSVCDMRIAVDRPGRSEGVDYVDVTAFDKQAEACAEHLSKGRQVAVDGRLSYSQWEAEDGSKRSRLKVIGNVQFLGGKPSEGSSSEQPAEEEPVAA